MWSTWVFFHIYEIGFPSSIAQMNLMVGYWCPIIQILNPKARVDVKNGQLKAIKTALRLS